MLFIKKHQWKGAPETKSNLNLVSHRTQQVSCCAVLAQLHLCTCWIFIYKCLRARQRKTFESFYVCIRLYVLLILVLLFPRIFPTVQSITFQSLWVFEICQLHQQEANIISHLVNWSFLNLNAFFFGAADSFSIKRSDVWQLHLAILPCISNILPAP